MRIKLVMNGSRAGLKVLLEQQAQPQAQPQAGLTNSATAEKALSHAK